MLLLLLLLLSFETRKCDSSYFVLLFQGCFGYPGSLVISDEFKNQLVNFYKEISWDSDSNCVESTDQFGEYYHFNNKSSDS